MKVRNVPDFPTPDLGAAILKAIADATGRVVIRSSVYAELGSYIEVTAVLREDDAVEVRISDPSLAGGGA